MYFLVVLPDEQSVHKSTYTWACSQFLALDIRRGKIMKEAESAFWLFAHLSFYFLIRKIMCFRCDFTIKQLLTRDLFAFDQRIKSNAGTTLHTMTLEIRALVSSMIGMFISSAINFWINIIHLILITLLFGG